MSKNILFTLKSLDAYLEIYNLAISHGKKPGDSMAEEFQEIAEKHPDWFKLFGETNKDLDQLTGDIRENGGKVLNINEIQRRAELNKGDNNA